MILRPSCAERESWEAAVNQGDQARLAARLTGSSPVHLWRVAPRVDVDAEILLTFPRSAIAIGQRPEIRVLLYGHLQDRLPDHRGSETSRSPASSTARSTWGATWHRPNSPTLSSAGAWAVGLCGDCPFRGATRCKAPRRRWHLTAIVASWNR